MKWLKKIQWISLPLSIAAFVISWLRIDVYMTNDTFVGIMAGFMGACATIVVGAQIYNSIETSKKIKELEGLQTQVAKDIEYLKKERKRGDHFTKYGIHFSLGLSTSTNNVFFAYASLGSALKEALILNTPNYINIVLSDMEILCEVAQNKKNLRPATAFNPEEYLPDNYIKYQSYPLIEDRYKKCYEIILEAHKRCQEQSKTAS